MHTIVLGLGNPILGDDGVGCRVAREVEKRLGAITDQGVEVDQFFRGGIALMERLVGFNCAIIVDSIQGLGGLPGTLHRLTLDDLPTCNANSPHDASFKAALEMGRSLGAELPQEIVIFGVEIESACDFLEELSSEVEAAVNPTVQAVLQELHGCKSLHP